jgi:hypothetical protein
VLKYLYLKALQLFLLKENSDDTLDELVEFGVIERIVDEEFQGLCNNFLIEFDQIVIIIIIESGN